MNFQVATHQTEGYQIQTPLYEGPLDLLLDLIERAELDITKLALAQVTDQYLEYLTTLVIHNAAEVSAFLVIASRLLQIKSASLLPRPTLTINPTESEEDLGEALAQQLIKYKRFKEISALLRKREEEGLRTYLRISATPPKAISKFDLGGISLDELIIAARNVFQFKSLLPSLSEVVTMPRITIRQKIHAILNIIKATGNRTSFKDILQTKSRIEIVVSFLAILELIKRRVIEAQQLNIFGDIDLLRIGEWNEKDETEIEFSD